MKSFSLALLVAAAVIPAFPVVAGVETIHDPEADFGAYETYEWMESKDVPQIPEIRRYLLARIDARLQDAGLTREESGGDLKVGVRVGTTIETSASMSYTGEVPWTVGYVWRGDRSINETTLIVDVIDAAANHAVWQGFAAETFYDQARTDYGRLRKKIDTVVAKMFRAFPPKPGK